MKTIPLLPLVLTLMTLQAGPSASRAATAPNPPTPLPVDLLFNTQTQFAGCFRDGAIDVHSAPGQARLVRSTPLIDWMGYRIGWDTLSTQYEGRIQFTVEPPLPDRMEIHVFHSVRGATLNGAPLTFTPHARSGWSMAETDGRALRAGANELRFAPGTRLAYDRDVKTPLHSQISRDGGQTWQAAPGEYLIRLRLNRFAPAGILTSPVIDLANPRDENRLCPLAEIESAAVAAEADTPAGTEVILQARSGSTRLPDPQWSDWHPATQLRPARFLQWRAHLRTTRPDATPALKSVRVSGTLKIRVPAGTPDIARLDITQPPLIRSSYPFAFQPPSARLARLRQEWRLDDIVAPGKTDLEKFILLRNWVRRQWPHNEGNCGRPWDALDILAAPPGDHGMCVHFAVVFTQCAQALGYNARQIILANHYVADIWSAEHQKWILMDVEAVQKEALSQWGTALYWDSQTDTPMSAVDLHRVAYRDRAPERIIQKLTLQTADRAIQTVDRRYGIEEYANFHRIAGLVRNNYLDQLEPWEVAHGVDYYHCDEYLWWREGVDPIVREFTRHTDREGDFEWTIDTVALTLTRAETPDRLSVQAETLTPNFKEFRFRFNAGPWQTSAGSGPDPHSRLATLEWPLQPGTNTLDIQTRNRFDRDGAPSRVVLRFDPP